MKHLQIYYKKSPVKFGDNKSVLFEVKWSGESDSNLFFVDRSEYEAIKREPLIAIGIVRTRGGLSNLIEQSNTISVIYKGFLWNKKMCEVKI